MQDELFNEKILTRISAALEKGREQEQNPRKVVSDIMFILATGAEEEQTSYQMGLMYEKMGAHLQDLLRLHHSLDTEPDALETLLLGGRLVTRFRTDNH